MKYGVVHQQRKLVKESNIGAIILCRFNSSRLPGKALIQINNKPILEYVIERVSQVFDFGHIVIATSEENSDDQIYDFCVINNFQCFRGSLDNVAKRFYECGIAYKFDYLMRINGDNVFADVNLIRRALNLVKTEPFDFVSNVKNRTFPKGMSVEVIKTSYFSNHLKEIYSNADFSEHVTKYFYTLPQDNHAYIYNELNLEIAGLQMALDTNSDLKRTKEIIKYFNKPQYKYGLEELFQINKEYGIFKKG